MLIHRGDVVLGVGDLLGAGGLLPLEAFEVVAVLGGAGDDAGGVEVVV